MSTPADIAIYGGAAGGGKSYALLLDHLRHVHLPDYRGIIFRRRSTEITGGGGLWDEACTLYAQTGAVSRGQPFLDWTWPSGARVQFSHLQHRDDVQSHQSRQYAVLDFDELTQFEESQFWYMLSRNRSTCGIRPYIRCATNPDPDSFVRKLIDWWIGDDGLPIPERSGVLRWFLRFGDDLCWYDTRAAALAEPRREPEQLPQSLTFIGAKLEDNPKLIEKDPGYRSRLMVLQRVEREQLEKGNWNVRAQSGNFFKRREFGILPAVPTGALHTIRVWDKAATEPHERNRDPDWTAGVKMLWMPDKSIVIEHVERFRGSPGKVEAGIKRIAQQDGDKCIVGLFEDPGQAGKVDIANMTRILHGYTIKTERTHKDKETCAGPLSSQVESGNVSLVQGEWNEAFLKEAEGFPDGAHDDQVDGASGGYNKLCEIAQPRTSVTPTAFGGATRQSPWRV